MILDYENAIREKITRNIWNYAEANHKYMYDYDETKESTYFQYVDFKSQHEWAIFQCLHMILL